MSCLFQRRPLWRPLFLEGPEAFLRNPALWKTSPRTSRAISPACSQSGPLIPWTNRIPAWIASGCSPATASAIPQRAASRSRRNFVDQTQFAGLGGLENPAGEREFQGPALAQGGGHGVKDQERPEPQADFGEAEGGSGSARHDVAIGDQSGAAAQRGPWTAAISGLARRAPEGEQLLVEQAERVRNARTDLAEVHPGAEGLAAPGEQNGADGRILFGVLDRSDEGAGKLCIEGVALIGAIDGNPQNPAGAGDF